MWVLTVVAVAVLLVALATLAYVVLDWFLNE